MSAPEPGQPAGKVMKVGYGSRPCENGWSRGVERPWVSSVPIAEVRMFQLLW
jgi:hypothetical protein